MPQLNVEEANVGRPRMYDEALRERLIEEARSMLSTDGYHGVSLRVLTRNVGTSTNAVYTLFGSKEALMAEGIVRDLEEKLSSRSKRKRRRQRSRRRSAMSYKKSGTRTAPKREPTRLTRRSRIGRIGTRSCE